MAKKIDGYIKLQVPAGTANPSPPIGPALGQRGVNIMEFCKAFNAATAARTTACAGKSSRDNFILQAFPSILSRWQLLLLIIFSGQRTLPGGKSTASGGTPNLSVANRNAINITKNTTSIQYRTPSLCIAMSNTIVFWPDGHPTTLNRRLTRGSPTTPEPKRKLPMKGSGTT